MSVPRGSVILEVKILNPLHSLATTFQCLSIKSAHRPPPPPLLGHNILVLNLPSLSGKMEKKRYVACTKPSILTHLLGLGSFTSSYSQSWANFLTYSLNMECTQVLPYTFVVGKKGKKEIRGMYDTVHTHTSLGFRQFYEFLHLELGKFFDLFP